MGNFDEDGKQWRIIPYQSMREWFKTVGRPHLKVGGVQDIEYIIPFKKHPNRFAAITNLGRIGFGENEMWPTRDSMQIITETFFIEMKPDANNMIIDWGGYDVDVYRTLYRVHFGKDAPPDRVVYLRDGNPLNKLKENLALSDPINPRKEEAIKLWRTGKYKRIEIARKLDVGAKTITRYLKEEK